MMDPKQQAPANQIDYAALLTALCSSDAAVRKPAEDVYNNIPAKDRFTILGSTLCQQDLAEELKTSSAVLLRRLIVSSWQDIQSGIPFQQLLSSCNQLLLLLQNSYNVSKAVRDQICNVISSLARQFLDERTFTNQWSDFVTFMFEIFRSPDVNLRQAAFTIFTSAPDVLGTVNGTTAFLDQLTQIFMQNLNEKNQSNQFYVSLISAVCALMATNTSKQCTRELAPLTTPIIEILRSIDDMNDKETICQQLIEVAESCPTIFRSVINPLLQTCVEFMTINDGCSDIRDSALELCVSLIESAPNMVKKRGSDYIKPIILHCLQLMTEIEDDPEWHTSSLGERDEDEPDVLGETALDRISCALGGKVVLPILTVEVERLLAKPEWQSRHAALMALSSGGEGCKDQLQGVLDRVVSGILQYLKDPHPRVRYAACNTIGQMSTDFSPEFEERFHSQAIPALLELVIDFSFIRVQTHAAAALVNFFEECPQEILANYLEPASERLQAVLSKLLANDIPKEECQRFALEQIVVTLSALADTAQETFKPHYSKFMPCLKFIIQVTTNNDELRMLRGKAIECISLIGIAVGKEQFIADASEIMQMLLATQMGQNKLDDDDPQLSYMMAAWARICKILGPDFKAYLPYVMGPVLQAASHKVEFALLSEEDKAAIENGNNSWECLNVQDQSVGIRTAGLEDKATACSMLVCYARELKQDFAEYVQQTAEVLVPLLKFPLHDEVRDSAAECLPHLLEASLGRPEQEIMVLWEVMYTNLYSAIQAESDTSVLNAMLESLGNCITTVKKERLSVDKVQQIIDLLKEKFKTHFDILAQQYEECKDEDYEADSICSDDEDQECLAGISDVIDALFIVLKAEFFPYFDQLLEPILELTSNKPHIPARNRQNAICIWNGLIENTGQSCVKYQDYFLQLFARGISDESMGIKEAAFYGIGVLAEQTKQTFTQFYLQVLPTMLQFVQAQKAQNQDDVNTATETALATLEKLAQHCNIDLNARMYSMA